MSRRCCWLLGVSAILLLGGCTIGADSAEPEAAGTGAAVSPGAQSTAAPAPDRPPASLAPRPTPPAADSDPGPDPPAHGGALADCDEPTRSAIAATVAGQLEAFAAGDFAAALGFASATFQEEFDAATFEALVTEEFPVVAGNTGHTTLGCATDGQVAESTVSVRARTAGQTLRYLLTLQDGVWRIAGAIPEDTAPVI